MKVRIAKIRGFYEGQALVKMTLFDGTEVVGWKRVTGIYYTKLMAKHKLNDWIDTHRVYEV